MRHDLFKTPQISAESAKALRVGRRVSGAGNLSRFGPPSPLARSPKGGDEIYTCSSMQLDKQKQSAENPLF